MELLLETGVVFTEVENGERQHFKWRELGVSRVRGDRSMYFRKTSRNKDEKRRNDLRRRAYRTW